MKIKMSVAVATLLLSLPLAAHAEGDAKKGEKSSINARSVTELDLMQNQSLQGQF